MVYFVKQKTEYEMRISDWSSDVCSSDLKSCALQAFAICSSASASISMMSIRGKISFAMSALCIREWSDERRWLRVSSHIIVIRCRERRAFLRPSCRSEEHTSELQSLMRISYAVFCLKKKTTITTIYNNSSKTKH